MTCSRVSKRSSAICVIRQKAPGSNPGRSSSETSWWGCARWLRASQTLTSKSALVAFEVILFIEETQAAQLFLLQQRATWSVKHRENVFFPRRLRRRILMQRFRQPFGHDVFDFHAVARRAHFNL